MTKDKVYSHIRIQKDKIQEKYCAQVCTGSFYRTELLQNEPCDFISVYTLVNLLMTGK